MAPSPSPLQRRRALLSVRLFTDTDGRRWSATRPPGGSAAIAFVCRSDPRVATRAIAVDDSVGLAEADEDTLRAWLTAAPQVAILL